MFDFYTQLTYIYASSLKAGGEAKLEAEAFYGLRFVLLVSSLMSHIKLH